MVYGYSEQIAHVKGLKIGMKQDQSLGIRLTRVKRLSRKRCCDTTPDCCQEGSRLTILFRMYNMLRLLPNRGLVGSQVLKCTKKYGQRPCLRRNSLLNGGFWLSWAPQKLAFLQIQSSNFILQILSSNCNLPLQSPRFFRLMVEFQHIKNLLKKSKIK